MAWVGHSFRVGGADAPATPTVAAGLLSADAVLEGAAACCAGAAAGAVATGLAGAGCALRFAVFGAGRDAAFGTETGGRGA